MEVHSPSIPLMTHHLTKTYPRTINRRFFLEARGRLLAYQPLLIGAAEMSNLLGIPRQSLCNWRVRFNFIPDPTAELAQGPTWERAKIWNWIARELEDMGEPVDLKKIVNSK